MRLAVCFLVLALGACAHMNQPELAIGQAWRFRDAPSAEARVIIARVEPRGGRRVVHFSILGLPMPPEAGELIQTMEASVAEIAPEPAASEPPTQIILGGMFDQEWYSGFVILDKATESASIPHIALYEDDLRSAVTELIEIDRAQYEHFDFAYQLWEQGEREWPSLHDSELTIPLASRVRDALRSVPDLLQTLRSDAPSAKQ